MVKRIFLLGVVAATLFPAPPVAAAPAIAFLNPSGYSTTLTISDVQDGDGFVHLVAWTRDTPSSALVEFELKPPGQNAATFTGNRVGADTWEAFVPLPDSFADGGGYTLIGRLYSGVPGNADEVANTQMTVEVNQSAVPPPNGEAVELSYPENGDGLGIYVPKGKRPLAVFDYVASQGTRQVRAFYTLSAPGTKPVWEGSCGSSVPDALGVGKVRCTLSAGHAPRAVTAVAVVSNTTSPPTRPHPALDRAGDAHRVLPYLQRPTSITVGPGPQTVTLAACHQMTASVNDQFDRPIPRVNVDVHAEGPEGQLFFSSSRKTHPFRAPTRAHGSIENARRCSNNGEAGHQGVHQNPGDDVKHIESVRGTSNSGAFRFALRSDLAGGTFIVAWADVNDDDQPGLREVSGGTQLGWGAPPPTPRVEVFLLPRRVGSTTGSCTPFEILARRGGGPFLSANVDIHLTGPEANIDFCSVPGGSTTRPPESGGHIGNAHEDGTLHAEGEANESGSFTFGITSGARGTSAVRVWVDTNDDDVPTDDPSDSASVNWFAPGERTISLSSSKDSVDPGDGVRLMGRVRGDPSCLRHEAVKIQSKRQSGGTFKTVKILTTDDEGRYSTRVAMQSSRAFRALAPETGNCSRAQSEGVTVRIR